MSVRAVMLVLVTVLVSGCATTPTASFYALSAPPSAGSASTDGRTILIGPVDLPEYLQRPQIVSRAGTRLVVDEFHRWGGRLEEEFVRVLSRRLGSLLGTQQVFAYPSRVVADADHRVALDVRRFDGMLGGEVVLDVAWSVVDERSGEVVATRQQRYVAVAGAADYDAYAEALSGLVGQFADDVAAALRDL
jgi:uncharacterized lipoprotein YmbA